jgi:hypothetical protein
LLLRVFPVQASPLSQNKSPSSLQELKFQFVRHDYDSDIPFITDFSELKNLPVGSFVRTVKGKPLADFVYVASSSVFTSVPAAIAASAMVAGAASLSSSSRRKTVLFMNAFYPTPESLETMERDRCHRFSEEGAVEAHRELSANSFDLYFVLCVPDFFFGHIAYPKTQGVPHSASALRRFSVFEMSLPLVGCRPPTSRRRGTKRKVAEEGDFILLSSSVLFFCFVTCLLVDDDADLNAVAPSLPPASSASSSPAELYNLRSRKQS